MHKPTLRTLWCVSLACALAAVRAFGQARAGRSDGPTAQELTEFGESVGQPVDGGFVFFDGRYVDAPYVVSNRGLDLYVNEFHVGTLGMWPPVNWGSKKPDMPDGLTRQSTFEDLAIPDRPGDSLDRQMVRWLRRHYNDHEAKRRVTEFFKSLPFVKDVEPDLSLSPDGHTLAITTWTGEGDRLFDIGPSVYVPTAEEVEETRRRLEVRLRRGELHFCL